MRFEHCYRLDLDPKIAPPHRHACWKQWLNVYSYGQPKDRFEYARRRLGELEAGDPSPPRLNLETKETRTARQFYMSTPTPVNVHAPPPSVAPVAEELSAPPEGDPCVSECRKAREACLERCGSESGAQEGQGDTREEPTAAPKNAARPSTAAKPEDAKSAASECACEQDYKMCGARCFE